jgi:hypothetical protein
VTAWVQQCLPAAALFVDELEYMMSMVDVVVFGQEADFHKFSQRFARATWPKVVVWPPAMSRLLLLLLPY